MANAREFSAASSVSTIPSTQRGPNSLAMVGHLYKQLSPQLSKSYRPHVVYVPTENERRTATKPTDKKRKLRTANIVIEAMNKIQKKKEIAGAFKAAARQLSKDEEDNSAPLKTTKENSKSMPNLSTGTS